jgi:hypothetical protein
VYKQIPPGYDFVKGNLIRSHAPFAVARAAAGIVDAILNRMNLVFFKSPVYNKGAGVE